MTQNIGTPTTGLGITGKLLAILLPLGVVATITSGAGLWGWMLEPAQKSGDVAGAVARIVAYGGGVAAVAAFGAVWAYGVGSGKIADALQGVATSLAFWSATVIGLFSFLSLK